MKRLTMKYDNQYVLKDMCTIDRTGKPKYGGTCAEECFRQICDAQGCDTCPIQKAFNKLAEYENLEEQGNQKRQKNPKIALLTKIKNKWKMITKF